MFPIPANATRIRYLGSTGTQYIDTGIAPGNNELDFEIDFANEQTSTSYQAAFGCRDNTNGTYVPESYAMFLRSSDPECRIDIANSGSSKTMSIDVGTRYVLSWDSAQKTLTKTVVSSGATGTATSNNKGVCEYTFALFGVNTNGTISSGAVVRVYSAKLYKSGVLVRDFVPLRVGSTGYLFDRVSGQLFGNAADNNAGFPAECCGPDTFAQGVVPTRMMAMGVRRKPEPPSVFNYMCFKFVASRWTRTCTSLADIRSKSAQMFQFSELEFINSSGSRYAYPSDMTVSYYTKFDGERHYSTPVIWTIYNSGENVGRIFDNSTSTKWGPYNLDGFSNTYANVYDFDTGVALMVSGGSYDATFRTNHFGAFNKHPPASLVLDVSSSPLDITTYSRWQFLNANDNASATGRTIVEGEILGSVDKQTWWRLDIFNDTSIPNTNKAVAYTGNLVARPGDIWSDIDLMDRDWANGIAVDGI